MSFFEPGWTPYPKLSMSAKPAWTPRARASASAHELDGTGGAAPQGGDHRSELVGQDRDDDQVVGCRLVEGAGDVDLDPCALDVNDGAVALEVSQSWGAWPRDDGDIVTAGARQMKSEGAPDPSGADDGDAERRRGGGDGP